MAFVGLLLSLLAMASVVDAQGTPLVVGVQGTALPGASNATASATKAKKSGDDMARWPCATGCNGHGQCDEGRCVCEAGWTYYDCSISKSLARRSVAFACSTAVIRFAYLTPFSPLLSTHSAMRQALHQARQVHPWNMLVQPWMGRHCLR